MDECIFCKIAQKKDEAAIIHEGIYTLAFMDLYPASNGHILIIPKHHYKTFSEITDKKVLNELISDIQTLCSTLVQKKFCTDYTIIQNNGEYADQDIQHVHFHIIPRYQNDFINIDLNTKTGKASINDLMKIVKTLK